MKSHAPAWFLGIYFRVVALLTYWLVKVQYEQRVLNGKEVNPSNIEWLTLRYFAQFRIGIWPLARVKC